MYILGIIQYNLNRDLIPKNSFNFTKYRLNDLIQKKKANHWKQKNDL